MSWPGLPPGHRRRALGRRCHLIGGSRWRHYLSSVEQRRPALAAGTGRCAPPGGPTPLTLVGVPVALSGPERRCWVAHRGCGRKTSPAEPGEVSPSRFRHPSQDAPFASLRATPSDPRCRELARFEGARPPPGRAPSSDNLGAGKTLRAQPREPGLAAMDKTTGQVGPHRDTLIKRGLCYSPRYGVIAFTVPMFDQFVQRWLG